jgi:hypothetical protein
MTSGLQLDRDALTQRVREQSADLMTQTACILQGGVLSAAGFGLIEILRHPTDGLIRVMLWVVSLIVSFIIFFRLAIRAPFYMRSSADVFLVIPILGVCEIVLFACLTLSEPGDWRIWYLGGVLLSLVGLPANAMLSRSVQARRYAVEIEPVFIFLRSKTRAELAEAVALLLFTAAVGAAVWLLPPDWPYAPALIAGYLAVSVLTAAFTLPREMGEIEKLLAAIDV